MSNPNWNKDTNAGRNSKGGVKGNWSDRGTNSVQLLKVASIIGPDLKILNGRINGIR